MKKISNKNTFKFFDYKWKRVPNWAEITEKKYIKWYLQRYKYNNYKNFKIFLNDKNLIMEAGCGLARDSKLFAKLNPKAKIIAIDQSKNAISTAKKKLKDIKNIHFIQGDITKKIKIKNKFDFISCDQVLHHTPNPEKTLKNLYSNLKKDGFLNFFVCKKKNSFRDFVDDQIMNFSRKMSPKQLWDFSEKITEFGRALYNLNIKNIKFNNQKYKSLQLFVHYNNFRCWYDPNIDFNLSVSSNYDWFSNNPRYDVNDVRQFMKNAFNKYKLISLHEDNASISCSIRKLD